MRVAVDSFAKLRYKLKLYSAYGNYKTKRTNRFLGFSQDSTAIIFLEKLQLTVLRFMTIPGTYSNLF